MTKFERAHQPTITIPNLKEKFKHLEYTKGWTDAEWQALGEQINDNEIFMNDTYQVNIRRLAGTPTSLIHLSIKRIDKNPIRVWRDMQEIKNQLVGPEYEAVELYPAESRLVDSANQYHLWCIDDPTYRFPFGYEERFVMDGTGELNEDNSKQEPFKRKTE